MRLPSNVHVPRAQWQAQLTSRPMRNVVVLGANGAMGSGSAGLFAAAVDKVTLLARSRDRAQRGREMLLKQLRSHAPAARLEVGDYDADLERCASTADLIFEAVAEDLETKRDLFERVDRCRRLDGIVATVSSGLSIRKLSEGRSRSFQEHFLGLHFFNPPNVIVGTELIPGPATAADVTDFVELFVRKRLGRVSIRVNDTPGFAGNRVGFKVLNEAAQLVEEHGVALVDGLLGPFTGRALPPLRTIDLVGWDIHASIMDNLFENTRDEAHESLRVPPFMRALQAQGTLGNKSGAGFYKRAPDVSLHLALPAGTYEKPESIESKLPFLREVCDLHRVGRYRDALGRLFDARGEPAEMARRLLLGYISYAFHRVGEVVETIGAIDDIMSFGFNWAPPTALVHLVGHSKVVDQLEKLKIPVPSALIRANQVERPNAEYLHGWGRLFAAK